MEMGISFDDRKVQIKLEDSIRIFQMSAPVGLYVVI